jgi:hypothetical protein
MTKAKKPAPFRVVIEPSAHRVEDGYGPAFYSAFWDVTLYGPDEDGEEEKLGSHTAWFRWSARYWAWTTKRRYVRLMKHLQRGAEERLV